MQSSRSARQMIDICRAASLCGLLVAGSSAWAQPGDAAARGAAKAASCDSCHGTAERLPLAGMPTLSSQPREFLVLQMFFMREGLREVPQMTDMLKGFTDRDLEDVAAHYSRQPLPRSHPNADPKLTARGASLSAAMGCGSCHLADYRGQKHVPRLSNQREDYLAATLKAYRDNKRTGTDTSMNAAMYQVADSDIQALAHYLAHR